MFIRVLPLFILIIAACNHESKTQQITTHEIPPQLDDQIETLNEFIPGKYLLVSDIPLPKDYTRVDVLKGSFAEYLRSLQLKHDNRVLYFDGSEKTNASHWAVIEMDIGNRDLQQCADAVMRLKAEYHYGKKEYNKIHFNFTSGHQIDYVKYAEGNRTRIKGNSVSWYKGAAKDYSYQNFRKYMDLIFNYAGSFSLSKELTSVPDLNDIEAGYILIEGGFPGHAVIVVDVAQHKETGAKIFMVAQSYMPAQETHILINPNNSKISPWYSTTSKGNKLETPEWTFDKNTLKKFKN